MMRLYWLVPSPLYTPALIWAHWLTLAMAEQLVNLSVPGSPKPKSSALDPGVAATASVASRQAMSMATGSLEAKTPMLGTSALSCQFRQSHQGEMSIA